jgi:ribosome-associated protein
MDEAKQLALYLAELLNEKHAEDIVLLEVEQLVGYTSWFIVASGRSERQVKAMGDHLARQGRADGVRPMGVEGLQEGNWGLLDFGDVVVHLFRGEDRYLYDLESLWEEAPRIDYPIVEAGAEAASAEDASTAEAASEASEGEA